MVLLKRNKDESLLQAILPTHLHSNMVLLKLNHDLIKKYFNKEFTFQYGAT